MNESPAPLPAAPKPGKLQTIGILMMINGVLNVVYNLAAGTTLVLSILGAAIPTYGLGLCCLPLAIIPALPFALGFFELFVGARLISAAGEPQKRSRLQTIAILEICAILFFNVISLAVGIINLILISDPEVKEYCRE